MGKQRNTKPSLCTDMAVPRHIKNKKKIKKGSRSDMSLASVGGVVRCTPSSRTRN
jgi:hypothetical protein